MAGQNPVDTLDLFGGIKPVGAGHAHQQRRKRKASVVGCQRGAAVLAGEATKDCFKHGAKLGWAGDEANGYDSSAVKILVIRAASSASPQGGLITNIPDPTMRWPSRTGGKRNS